VFPFAAAVLQISHRVQRVPNPLIFLSKPTKIEFHLNKKTAMALGLTLPNTLLVAATDVVQ